LPSARPRGQRESRGWRGSPSTRWPSPVRGVSERALHCRPMPAGTVGVHQDRRARGLSAAALDVARVRIPSPARLGLAALSPEGRAASGTPSESGFHARLRPVPARWHWPFPGQAWGRSRSSFPKSWDLSCACRAQGGCTGTCFHIGRLLLLSPTAPMPAHAALSTFGVFCASSGVFFLKVLDRINRGMVFVPKAQSTRWRCNRSPLPNCPPITRLCSHPQLHCSVSRMTHGPTA
jgi:hypothetical protein